MLRIMGDYLIGSGLTVWPRTHSDLPASVCCQTVVFSFLNKPRLRSGPSRTHLLPWATRSKALCLSPWPRKQRTATQASGYPEHSPHPLTSSSPWGGDQIGAPPRAGWDPQEETIISTLRRSWPSQGDNHVTVVSVVYVETVPEALSLLGQGRPSDPA